MKTNWATIESLRIFRYLYSCLQMVCNVCVCVCVDRVNWQLPQFSPIISVIRFALAKAFNQCVPRGVWDATFCGCNTKIKHIQTISIIQRHKHQSAMYSALLRNSIGACRHIYTITMDLFSTISIRAHLIQILFILNLSDDDVLHYAISK